MINNVTIIGRLTRDAELRYTPSNIATAQFNVACNRNFKNASGEYDADFINCVMWREQAERFCNAVYIVDRPIIEQFICLPQFRNKVFIQCGVFHSITTSFGSWEDCIIRQDKKAFNASIVFHNFFNHAIVQ